MNDSGTPRPPLRGLSGGLCEPDQVPRLIAFRNAHPDVSIVLDGLWRAVVPSGDGETVVTRYELRALLDKLDGLLGPATQDDEGRR